MYEECPALLQMTRTFLEDGEKDEIIHHCKVIRYDPEEENICERYCNKVGKVLVFRVQNGFYEKNINKIK